MTPTRVSQRFEQGVQVRSEVLGSDYVARQMRDATPFGMPLQELITEYAWGGIWSRQGLDRRTRSLLTLAMLTALNRPAELRAHVRGAVNNGCTREEVREALLQSAVYCGLPAAIDAFEVAEVVLAELDTA